MNKLSEAALFNSDEIWIAHMQSIRFTGKVGDREIKCFISRKVLEDHFDVGAGDIKDIFIHVFRANRKAIYKASQRLINKGVVSREAQFIISTYNF
jgi:hypothetical protein